MKLKRPAENAGGEIGEIIIIGRRCRRRRNAVGSIVLAGDVAR